MGTEFDVLQVITSSARRGAERFAVALEPELIARGLSVRTVALVPGEGPTLDVDHLGGTRLGPATLLGLRRAAGKAAVVVAHGSSTLPATAIGLIGSGIPFVYRNIGDPAYWATSHRRRAQTAACLARAAKVVALTSQTAERITLTYDVAAERIIAIPRGIDPDEFRPRTEQTYRVSRSELGFDDSDRVAVCVGALSPEKNVAGAVEALAELPARWQLVIAGDGPDRATVERAAAAVGADRVRLLGSTDDPAALMSAADLLVLPSHTEGLPGVVIEAAMVGVPAVVTDVGFVREIVDDGASGMIVPAADSSALAAAVLEAEPKLEAMGRAAQARAGATFALPRVADAWYDLLAPLVDPAASKEGMPA